jgi:hypothetical protein
MKTSYYRYNLSGDPNCFKCDFVGTNSSGRVCGEVFRDNFMDSDRLPDLRSDKPLSYVDDCVTTTFFKSFYDALAMDDEMIAMRILYLSNVVPRCFVRYHLHPVPCNKHCCFSVNYTALSAQSTYFRFGLNFVFLNTSRNQVSEGDLFLGFQREIEVNHRYVLTFVHLITLTDFIFIMLKTQLKT